jgi:purine-binding chemotaxis protein CheW
MIAKPPSSSGIDWEEVKRRLTRLQESIALSHTLPAEKAAAVMDERARILARAPDPTPDASEILNVTTFLLGEERFAIETRVVREVYRPSHVTPLPDTPGFLVGLTNLRGEVLSLVDLRLFFNLPAADPDPHAQVLVLGDERPEFAVITDGVQEVLTLRLEQILEPPGTVSGAGRTYLRGVTRDALLLIDGEALLNDERLYIDDGTSS